MTQATTVAQGHPLGRGDSVLVDGGRDERAGVAVELDVAAVLHGPAVPGVVPLALLDAAHRVQIVGPPGAAGRPAPDRAGRASQLLGVVDIDGLCTALAAALGVSQAAGTRQEAVEQLGQRLLAGWLAQGQGQLVLTSRQRLGLPEEHCVAVGALPEPEAVRLFVERARQARPGYEPSEAELGWIGELCGKLGLCELLERAPGGWRLAPQVPLAFAEE